jgi:MYXO-CTERM domain-containing protein
VNPPGKKLHSFSVCDQATGACDKGPPAEVPLANATVDGGGSDSGGGCGCTSVPTRSSSAGVVAMGVIAAMLLRRRKRED